MADEGVARVIHETLEKIREPLGLDRWTIKVETGDFEDPGACTAQPEYKQALLQFCLDKLETGDDLQEIVTHEAAHCHIGPIHDQAQSLATALASCAPEYLREALQRKLDEDVRLAAEDSTTQVGFAYIRMLRRLWQAEADLAAARAEVKALKKAARDTPTT